MNCARSSLEVSADLDIHELLSGLGFAGTEAYAAARQALETARLTNKRKTRIDAAKRSRVEALLAERFLVTCGNDACDAKAAGREVLAAASPEQCAVCAGSANKRTLDTARDLARRAGITHIVVVGGAPGVHEELRRLTPPEWEVRIVVGTVRRTADQAKSDLQWADVVVVWGSTELDHKVSALYTVHRDPRCVLINRRGLSSLFEAVSEHAKRRRST